MVSSPPPGDPVDPVVIRDGVVPDDVDLCADIWVRALLSRDGTVDSDAMAQRVRSALGTQIVRFAVATSPRNGFALVAAGRPDPTEALLRFLAVDPDGAGSGVGTALLFDAVNRSTLAGFQHLTLEVRSTNTRAIALYTRRGFVPFGAQVAHPLGGDPMQSYRLPLS